MIKDVKIQALQIGDIAGDVNGENLSFAVRFRQRPADESLDHQTAV
jgi:hypothetical protein